MGRIRMVIEFEESAPGRFEGPGSFTIEYPGQEASVMRIDAGNWAIHPERLPERDIPGFYPPVAVIEHTDRALVEIWLMKGFNEPSQFRSTHSDVIKRLNSAFHREVVLDAAPSTSPEREVIKELAIALQCLPSGSLVDDKMRERALEKAAPYL